MASDTPSTADQTATWIAMTPEFSCLIGLPPELRNNLYRLVLTTSDNVKVDKHLIARKALIETCSLVRKEASSIFYAENCFLITLDGLTVETSARWLKTLGSNAALIRNLEFHAELSDAAHEAICTKMLAASLALEKWKRVILASTFAQLQGRLDKSVTRSGCASAIKAGLMQSALKDSTQFDDQIMQKFRRLRKCDKVKGSMGLSYGNFCSGVLDRVDSYLERDQHEREVRMATKMFEQAYERMLGDG